MKSSKNPVGKILKSEEIKDSTAPLVASFSSRGPNKVAHDLLKPDIVAPGIDILAAYPLSPPTSSYYEKRKVKYTIMSGTSMACPHASGIAAYVRTFHPEWSPSAIQSAIMTTALPMNSTMNSGAEFDYGSGHLNPSGAINPGLVLFLMLTVSTFAVSADGERTATPYCVHGLTTEREILTIVTPP
ncbi:Subtilisin-like protease SBT4.4 [Euphorbia peplus]|nr:Subtilisin-like protease SBT4.4 [Euphorbia peplus]